MAPPARARAPRAFMVTPDEEVPKGRTLASMWGLEPRPQVESGEGGAGPAPSRGLTALLPKCSLWPQISFFSI